MKKVFTYLIAILALSAPLSVLPASPVQAQAAGRGCSQHLLTFPAWYRGLVNNKCDITYPGSGKNAPSLSDFIWKIALNVIEIMLQLVGYLAVGFIIVGGFRYLTSTGSPDGMAAAQKTILNAIIGLVISLFSVAVVNVIAGAF